MKNAHHDDQEVQEYRAQFWSRTCLMTLWRIKASSPQDYM